MGFLDKLLGREKKPVDTAEVTRETHDHDHDHGDAAAAAPAPSAAPDTPAASEPGESA